MNKLTPREYVHEAIRQGNGKRIANYMTKYFKLQEEKKESLVISAKKVFKS